MALAALDEPLLFFNWGHSVLIPRLLLEATQVEGAEVEFAAYDPDLETVERLRLTVSLVIHDLEQVRESILILEDAFPASAHSALRSPLGPRRCRTAIVNLLSSIPKPASSSVETNLQLLSFVSQGLTPDGRAVLMGASALLDSSRWSKFRASAQEQLHVESIVDFSGYERAFAESSSVAPVLMTLRPLQHSITRQVTAFAPASPGDSALEPGELFNAVVTFLNEGGQLPETIGFERPTAELDDRWDPKFYCPPRLGLQDRLISSPQAIWLGNVAQFIERGASPSALTPFITTRISGVTFEERQQAIANLKVGDQVWLRREPDNQYDPNAVHVERRSGMSLGYLPAELAAEVAEALDALNARHPAMVTDLRGGTHDQPYGATIQFAPPEYVHEGEAVTVIRPRDITNNQLTGQGEAAWLPREAGERVTRLRPGDILLFLRGFGKTCVVPRESEGDICHRDLAIIRPNEDVDPLYLLSFMVSTEFQEQLRFIARGVTVPIIDLEALSELLVIVPPLAEQRRIALAFAESQGDLGPAFMEDIGRWLELVPGEEAVERRWISSSLLSNLFSDWDQVQTLDDWLRLKSKYVRELRNAVAHARTPFPDQAVTVALLTLGTLDRILAQVHQDAMDLSDAAERVHPVLEEYREQVEWVQEPLLRTRFRALAAKLEGLLRPEMAPMPVQVRLEERTLPAGVPALLQLSVWNVSNEYLDSVEIVPRLSGGRILERPSWQLQGMEPDETLELEARVHFDAPGTAQMECDISYLGVDHRLVRRTTQLVLEIVPPDQVAFAPIQPNPYITGGAVDSPEMFFGRQDVLDFLRDNLIGKHQANIIILQGNRRTGKSSILKQIVNLDMFAPDVPVYIDCQGLGSLSDQRFFYKVARAIWKTLAKRDDCDRPPPVSRDEISEEDPFYDFQELLDRLVDVIPGRRVILLIDEFEVIDFAIQRKELSSLVLENLRHLFQHRHDLAVVLTGSYRLSRLGQEYWSALFGLGLKRQVGFLEESAVRQLITQPLAGLVGYAEEAIERIIQLTACQPYFVQMVCHNVVNVLNKYETPYVTQTYVEEAALETLVSADGHMRFMYESAGPNARKAVLVYLASSLTQPDTLNGHEIEAFAQESSLSLSFAELEEGLREMADRDIIQIKGTMEQRRYGFKIDLVRQWIRRNYDLRSAIALAQDASYVRED